MRSRENSSQRRSAHREPRVRLLVVCGGLCTEPDYFNGLKARMRNPAVTVKVLKKGEAPKNVVDYACSPRVVGTDEFDQVWCVVDADDFELDDAARAAAKASIALAVSNPCFELWLLLHHCDYRKPLADARAAQRELQRHVPAYRKEELRFDDFAAGIRDAVIRAKQLDPTGRDHTRNPSSGVWSLVQQMSDGGRMS